MSHSLSVPNEMKHPLFFEEDTIPFPDTADSDSGQMKKVSQFPFELLHWNGLEGGKPWLDSAAAFNGLLLEWKGIYAGVYVREGAALFISALFWLNGEPVRLAGWERRAAEFQVQPLNTAERLSYILSSPARYSSLIQLNELLEELIKKQSAALLKQKKKRI